MYKSNFRLAIKRIIFSSFFVPFLIFNFLLPPLAQADNRTALSTSELTQKLATPISYSGKKIVISLSREQLVAYDGNRIFLQTPVTTGGPGTPTPAGNYKVTAKLRNFMMNSPWPIGDWQWYASSFVHYGLEFQSGGYFIHDASWRSNFGPGSNSQLGTPGGTYTGTHGCVNVPLGAEATLYNWAEVGTTVIVQP